MQTKLIASSLILGSTLIATPVAHALDADAAQALAKKEGCLKCHAIDKAKDAKPLREIAAKYKGKADAEAKIEHHLHAGEKVKMADGTEEEHKLLKTKDKAEQKNLIEWILSLAK